MPPSRPVVEAMKTAVKETRMARYGEEFKAKKQNTNGLGLTPLVRLLQKEKQ